MSFTDSAMYANKMGEKYLKRYKKYFRDPEIREFDMQHEQWLFGEEKYAAPVLKAIVNLWISAEIYYDYT